MLTKEEILYVLNKINNDISIDVNFKFNKDNFYHKGIYYYLDNKLRMKKNIYYRICNSFVLKTYKTTSIIPIFIDINNDNNNLYHTLIRPFNNKFFMSTRILNKFNEEILNNKKTLYNILLKYFIINVNEVDKKIIVDYLFGKSYSKIAKEHNISRQRVEQICGKYVFISINNLKRLLKLYYIVKNKEKRETLLQYLNKLGINCEIKFISIISPYYKSPTFIYYFVKDNIIYFVDLFDELKDRGDGYVPLYFNNKVYSFIDNNNISTISKFLFIIKYNNNIGLIEKDAYNISKTLYIKNDKIKKYLLTKL